MTAVTIYKRSGQYAGFTIEGHAGYADEGQDIVCAAVSVLSLNTLNSIEAFTEDQFSGEEKDGFLSCSFPEALSEKAVLLLDSMVLGLTDIQRNYGTSYIRIVFKEV
ncbi:MAG TPA: ribosomal-processing cysteine protease Prp [Candidatus Merdisoma merdipullorum]|nr:ribosomal-processing cysteine protease Prp [Candidatus Merdisoma merdipullorum]